jgi:hypothetical protein
MSTRYFVILGFVFLFQRSEAQFTYGVDASIGAGLVDVENTNSILSFKERPGLSSSTGFCASYFFRKYEDLYLSSGLKISYIIGQFKYDDEDFAAYNISNFRSMNSSVFIGLPLLIGYRSNKFSIETGLETSYNLYQQTKSTWIETIRSTNRFTSQKEEVELKNNFLLSTNTSCEYRVMDRLGLRLTINVGLTDYLKQEWPTLNPDFKSRVNSALIGLRYHL